MGFAVSSVLPSWLGRRRDSVATPGPREMFWDALRATGYYRGRLPECWNQINWDEIEPISLGDYHRDVLLFANPGAPGRTTTRLQMAWQPVPKIAVLKPWFRVTGARVVDSPSCEGIAKLAPEALAGPVAILRGIIQAIEQGRLRLNLKLGVMAFSSAGRPYLKPKDRDNLWKALRVPVYEQFRGFEGEMLAGECEAHSGLHAGPESVWEVREGTGELMVTSLANLRHPVLRLRTGLCGRLDASVCGCGSTAARVRIEGVLSG